MANEKKQNKPRHVSIHFEHLMFDIDLMSNEQAGIILKMIVWYSAGTEESLSHLEEMKKYIDTLPEKGWLTGMYKRIFDCIDEEFDAYAEKCEKNRQIALEREERRRIKREQACTNVNEREQTYTNVNEREEKEHERAQTYTNVHQKRKEKEETTEQETEKDEEKDREKSTKKEIAKEEEKEKEKEKKEAEKESKKGQQQQQQQDASARKKKNLPKAKMKDFRKLWNNICNDFKERQQPCRLKFIKPGDLPGDAEERLNKVLREIYGGLTQEVANDVLDLYGCKTEEGRTMENAAKYYLVRAIENMAAVKMKMEDTSFGSFQWLMKSPERIRKMYDRDIQ